MVNNMYRLFLMVAIYILCNGCCYASTNSLTQMQITINANKKIQGTIHQVINSWEHTSVIGTINNPTIDGGIINNTDNIPVYHPAINLPLIVKTNNNNQPRTLSITNNTKINPNSGSFNDNWANSDRIRNILEDATKTQKLQYVLQQSKILKLPASVALVPIVESAYQDKAISSKGAVGAWQLMPNTAKEYGLNPYDRSNFVFETNAALTLLKNLHQKFGNWELAFAAYNAGSQRVFKALKKYPNAASIEDLNLPNETKNYVKRYK